MLITETHHGLICANSGPGRDVIVGDTFGRPWRKGIVPEGSGGLKPRRDPSRDLFR